MVEKRKKKLSEVPSATAQEAVFKNIHVLLLYYGAIIVVSSFCVQASKPAAGHNFIFSTQMSQCFSKNTKTSGNLHEKCNYCGTE